MSLVKDFLYELTGNDKHLITATFNGKQDDDPEQDVPQVPVLLIEDDGDE